MLVDKIFSVYHNSRLCVEINAELAELVDALDSGSSVCLGLPGSSPGFRIQQICNSFFFLFRQ